jgi:putative Holliday junction resolvase
MPPERRIVGVDYGARRTGLAVADPLALFARPLGVFSPGRSIEELVRFDARESIGTVVLGWPLERDGAEGAAVEAVRSYEGRLRKALPRAEIVRVDERFSSAEASSKLYEAGAMRRVRRDKSLVDAAAACVILEDYLRER